MDLWEWIIKSDITFCKIGPFPLFTNMYPENPPRPLESLLLNREMGAFIFCLVLIIRIRVIFSFQLFSLSTFSLLSLVDTFPGFNLPDGGYQAVRVVLRSVRWFCYLWQSVRHIAISRALLFLYQDNQSCATRPRSDIHTLLCREVRKQRELCGFLEFVVKECLMLTTCLMRDVQIPN